MPPRTSLVATLEIVTPEPETGLWCEPCALPSVIAVTYTITVGRRTELARVVRCVECGEQHHG